MLSTILLIFTLASVGLAVIMVLLNLFLAGRRSWIMGIVRVALTLVAALISIPIAKAISGYLVSIVYDFIVSGLGSDANELLETFPVGADGFRVLVSLVVAPILYLFVFILMRILLSVVGYIVCRFVPCLRARTQRNVAMPLGAANGLLMTLVILVPLCGLLAMGGRVLDNVVLTAKQCNSDAVYEQLDDMGASVDDIDELADELNEHPLIMTVSAAGKPIFSSLTRQELQLADRMVCKLRLENELKALTELGIRLIDAGDAVAGDTFGTEEREALTAVKDSLVKSEWLKHLMADGIRITAQTWQKNEAVIGVDRPSVDSRIQPVIDCLLEIFANETAASLSEDMDTIFDVVGDFMTGNLLDDVDDPQQLIVDISRSGLIKNITKTLETNPHFEPLAVEIRALSVRLLSDMLGLDQLGSGEHDELLKNASAELTAALNMSGDERDAFISTQLKDVFAQEGYDVPEDVAVEVANQVMDELGWDDNKVTDEELREYLIERAQDGTLPGDLNT